MPDASPSRSFLRRFARADRGATAVEFAMIALPFLALIFSVFELGMIFIGSSAVEAATVSAARQIRTGQLQTTGGIGRFGDGRCRFGHESERSFARVMARSGHGHAWSRTPRDRGDFLQWSQLASWCAALAGCVSSCSCSRRSRSRLR